MGRLVRLGLEWPLLAVANPNYTPGDGLSMVFHIVLFKVRPELSDEQRRAVFNAWKNALENIPAIRRAQVGRRIRHGRGYEGAMAEDMEYGAVIEFDDLAGLQMYLGHSAHDELGTRFWESTAAAYVYDYEVVERPEAG